MCLTPHSAEFAHVERAGGDIVSRKVAASLHRHRARTPRKRAASLHEK